MNTIKTLLAGIVSSPSTTLGAFIYAIGKAMQQAPIPKISAWSSFVETLGIILLGSSAASHGFVTKSTGNTDRITK